MLLAYVVAVGFIRLLLKRAKQIRPKVYQNKPPRDEMPKHLPVLDAHGAIIQPGDR